MLDQIPTQDGPVDAQDSATTEDALWHALAHRASGWRNVKELRATIAQAVNLAKGKGLSDAEIARHIGAPRILVADCRKYYESLEQEN